MDILCSDLIKLLVEKYFLVTDALAFFCVCKKFSSYHIIYHDQLIDARQGWFHCITNGKFLACKLLYEKNKLKKIPLRKKFKQSCSCGQLKIAQWLASLGNVIIKKNIQAFELACQNGHTDVAYWLFHAYAEKNIPLLESVDENLFKLCCTSGYLLDIAQLRIQYPTKQTKPIHFYHILLDTCYRGDLKIVKWIVEIYSKLDLVDLVDFVHSYKYCFIISCCSGHLNIAQWFYQIEPNDLSRTMNFDLFVRCCINGHLDVVQWLFRTGNQNGFPINIHAHDEYAFIISCEHGSTAIAQWLYQLSLDIGSPIDLRNQNAFNTSCLNGYFEQSYLLYQLSLDTGSPIIDIHISFPTFYGQYHQDIIRWLHQLSLETSSDVAL